MIFRAIFLRLSWNISLTSAGQSPFYMCILLEGKNFYQVSREGEHQSGSKASLEAPESVQPLRLGLCCCLLSRA